MAQFTQPTLVDYLEQWLKSARVEGAIAERGGSRIAFCRVNVWEPDKNAFSGFDVYRNLPFQSEQMETLIRGLFAQSD
ncbi:hypothetical protein [Limnospira fusiformis]|uniref:hypothetical protein n=1 Tax=Limnospira fusiformis TaxID=54297 RepID=UPI0014494955|nr:hypothetical protein HFV01_00855 [Limnospira fusiformis SAG 85.79]